MNDYFTWNPSSSTRIIPSEKSRWCTLHARQQAVDQLCGGLDSGQRPWDKENIGGMELSSWANMLSCPVYSTSFHQNKEISGCGREDLKLLSKFKVKIGKSVPIKNWLKRWLYNFCGCIFSKFWLPIWNQHNILRFFGNHIDPFE